MSKVKRIISLFFVALFVSYYASTTLFFHTHIISGATITHSHLHTDSHHDTTSGGHTEYCITLIAQASHFEYIDFSCSCALNVSQHLLYENEFVEITHWVTSLYFHNLSLRAPPII
ncbi:MAG: hypothetical protein FWC34_02145 [Bacteroidetes bacterium]|nr:hypothetical protein [Bacteroidota bacterium]